MNCLHKIPKGAQEFHLPLPYLRLEGLIWGAENPPEKTILALHGWLDNAMTFANLAPLIAKAGWRFIALELPGHGLSEWRPKGETYQLLDPANELFLAIKSLNLPKVILLGHSLGGIIMSFFTAAKNDLIDKLILIDSLGSVPARTKDVAKNLSKALDKWVANLPLNNNKLVVYPTIADAINARSKGFMPLSLAAATNLCQRGLKPTSGGFCWSTDPRLLAPDALRITEEENAEFLRNIKVPVLEVAGTKGLVLNSSFITKRLECIENVELVKVEGTHHLHLEEESYEAVGEAVINFLEKTNQLDKK